LTLASEPNPNSVENTLNQTVGEQMRAEELSLRATVPPAQVPGYRLERLLGQGAFGQVWVGNNLNTGRTVAIKFYLHRSGVNWSLLTREVKNLVSMSGNRFIVQVLEVGWDAEPPYYVMEYLENGSLDDLIRARGAMTVSKAVELFSDIASGLNHSHGKGVLHCDLKPANVLLDQDLQPRLADFGQSRLSTEQTPSLGTLFYMAPEQADLNAVPDARWDVYALGAIMYCMIVGSPPYKTPDTVTTLDTAASLPERLKRYRDTIYKSHFPRVHHRVRGMDRWMIAIIDRCIAKKPDDRFANVQQVLEALDRRHMARLRRPLMLLGIVGPLLLMAVMGLFGGRGITLAERELSGQLREKVWKSNLFAAKLAAGTLELEMATLFRLIEDEARRDEFGQKFIECVDEAMSSLDEDGNDLLHSLATQSTPLASQERLVGLRSRIALEEHLVERFAEITAQTGGAKRPAHFASMFVTDRFGTMLAAAFPSDPSEKRIGENFAYRSYFSGQTQDLDEATPRRNIARTNFSHMSVPFLSKSTNRWKIAVSTPISIERPESSKDNKDKAKSGEADPTAPKGPARESDEAVQVDGLMALTINLGDFELLSEESQRDSQHSTEDRFAVLVDGHEGASQELGTREGTILQHPVFNKPKVDSGKLTAQHVPAEQFQIDEEMLEKLKKKEGTFEYEDPVASSSIGKDFAGKWIAAMVRVDISRRVSDSHERKQSTNLWVLVQERADAITSPVEAMGVKLFREGIVALISLIAVISILWIVVLWVMRLPDSFAAAVRTRSGRTELTGSANELTLDAER
jgi:eukaryotic-like serine/threonine-protein kinase